MNRLERLYAINNMIRRNASRPISAARLAGEFGVSRRTIERDLASLRAAGVPLYGERGRAGGQRTAERPDTTIVFTLSTAEVTALLVALAAGGAHMPYSDAGTTAASRLLDSLPAESQVAVDELRGRIRAEATDQRPQHRRIRHTLEEAVRRSLVVNLDYVDRNDVGTTRPVDAVGFYQSGAEWFLIGFCRLRNGGRIFHLDRITGARLTKQASPPHDVDDVLGWVPNKTTSP